MKYYNIEISLEKVASGCTYKIRVSFETLAESFEEAFQKAQRYYAIAQAEEKAAGTELLVQEAS